MRFILSFTNYGIKFIGNSNTGETFGIRNSLHNRNKQVLEKINVQKEKWRNKELSDEEYQAIAKEIRNDSTLTRPVVISKAGPKASSESLIGALDEMQINQISRYQIDNINGVDSALIISYKKLNNIPVE